MAVSQSRPAYETRYLDNPKDGAYSRQTHYSTEQHNNLEQRLHNLDDKLRSKMVELEGGKHELVTIKSENRVQEKKIIEMESEKKALDTKWGTLEVKLDISNQNNNVSKEALEKLRTKMNDAQINVARLEERHTATAGELERLRDPANPEGNNSIKKHVVTDKKDIKRFKYEIDIENEFLQKEHELVIEKDVMTTKLESELESAIQRLSYCEERRREATEIEEEERIRKEELLEEYKHLRTERKHYDQRLKNCQVKLGVTVAGQKVNAKLAADVKKEEQKMSRRLTFLEKTCKEAEYELEVIRSRSSVTKTALSINDHTYRFKSGKNSDRALPGKPPVRYASDMRRQPVKAQGKAGSMPERLKLPLGQTRQGQSTQSLMDRRKGGARDQSPRQPLSDRTRVSHPQPQQRQQQQQQQQRTPRSQKPDKSTQFIPHPKPKIK